MNKSFAYIFSTLACFVWFSPGHAQDNDVKIVTDSVHENGAGASIETYSFKEITEAGEIDTRKIPQNDLRKIKSDEAYWYVNETPTRQNKNLLPPNQNDGEKGERINDNRNISIPSWLIVLLWIFLVAGFIALLIWFLSSSNIYLFRKKSKAFAETEQPTVENIFETDFENEIQKAIAEKNFRMAVRLLYLRSLRDLSDHNLIIYTPEKTNSDYLLQLAETSYYKSFFRLTRNFDYTWYGHFELSKERFSVIQNDFNSFQQQLV